MVTISDRTIRSLKHGNVFGNAIGQQRQYYLPFSNTAHSVHNTVQQLLQKSLHFISLELWHQEARAELNNQKIQAVHSSVDMSCNPTNLTKSSSDWLNSGKAVIQHLSEKDVIFMFPCFAGQCISISQVRWENKVPFDFLLSWQHFCQKLSKSVDVRRSYSKPKQCCFLRHCAEESTFSLQHKQTTPTQHSQLLHAMETHQTNY